MFKTIAKIFDVHPNTISNWKKENKPGLFLILKYFDKNDLEEFLQTGSVSRLDSAQSSKVLLNLSHGDGYQAGRDITHIPTQKKEKDLSPEARTLLNYFDKADQNLKDKILTYAISGGKSA